MKKIIFMAMLMISYVAFAQQEKNHFIGRCGLGVICFYNNSGISMLKYDKYEFSGGFGDVYIGMETKKGKEIMLNTFSSCMNMNYSEQIDETNYVMGIGLHIGQMYNISHNISAGLFLGCGMLISDAQIHYMDKDYNVDERLGTYVKFNLALEYNINNKSAFGLNFGNLDGTMKKKNLPTEFSSLQANHTNNIFSYSVSMFLKFRL